jgi:hypothetical protein
MTKTEKQLKVAFTAAREEYPGVLKWIEVATGTLQKTSVFLSAELPASLWK